MWRGCGFRFLSLDGLQALQLRFNGLLNGLATAGEVLTLHTGVQPFQHSRTNGDSDFGFLDGVAFCHTGQEFESRLYLGNCVIERPDRRIDKTTISSREWPYSSAFWKR